MWLVSPLTLLVFVHSNLWLSYLFMIQTWFRQTDLIIKCAFVNPSGDVFSTPAWVTVIGQIQHVNIEVSLKLFKILFEIRMTHPIGFSANIVSDDFWKRSRTSTEWKKTSQSIAAEIRHLTVKAVGHHSKTWLLSIFNSCMVNMLLFLKRGKSRTSARSTHSIQNTHAHTHARSHTHTHTLLLKWRSQKRRRERERKW